MSVIGPNGPRLLAEKCSTCIFRPGNPMDLRPGRVRQMVEDSIADGGFITCHKTLPYGDHPDAGEAICRGFYDAHGPRSNAIRVFARLDLIDGHGFDEVPEPGHEEGPDGS